MPKPLKSIWQNDTPGAFKGLTRWLSKPGTNRGRVTNFLRWKVRGQWKVGEDYIGNEFYLYQPFPETPIRRFCIFKQGQMSMDDLPFLWYQWVRYQRNYPPTKDELDEYDQYLRRTQAKAAQIAQREVSEKAANVEFYESQKQRLEEVQQTLTNKAQREVIALFQSRENALRIAAENKVAKLREADHIIQSERRRYEQLRFEKMKEAWTDPKSGQPSTDVNAEGYREEPFQPGAWRPWHEQDGEEDMDGDEQRSNDQK